MYISLTLYFDHRIDKRNKEFKKRVDNFKINDDNE